MGKITQNKVLLRHLKQNQPGWFNADNKKLFGDKKYYGYYSASGEPYLVRATEAWTDMFGDEPKLHYRINKVKGNGLKRYKVGFLIDETFNDIYEVKEWLKNN